MSNKGGSTWPDWERHEYASASRVKTFDDCEKQYWFGYHSGLEPTKPDNKYAKYGSAVHEAIEIALIQGLDNLRDHATEQFYRIADKHGLDDDMVDKGSKHIRLAAKFITSQDKDITQVEAEIPFTISAIDQHMAAKLDVVAEDEIWDWKTGKHRDRDWLQATVYKAAFVAEYGFEPSRVRFIYLQHGDIDNHDPGREEFEKLVEYLKRIRAADEAGQYPARPGEQCYWCDYEYYCPAADVGMGGVDAEAY